MMNRLQEAKDDPIWKNHRIGKQYSMNSVGGVPDGDTWKIAYYPLFGTYKGEGDKKRYVDFGEARALVEKPMLGGGTDFREVPLRYLIEK